MLNGLGLQRSGIGGSIEPLELGSLDHHHRISIIRRDALRSPCHGEAHILAEVGLCLGQLPSGQRPLRRCLRIAGCHCSRLDDRVGQPYARPRVFRQSALCDAVRDNRRSATARKIVHAMGMAARQFGASNEPASRADDASRMFAALS